MPSSPTNVRDTAPLKKQFAEVFGSGGKVHVVRAPGRVNLIGEHTDYNDGFVFPMAIEPEVLIVCRSRDDNKVRLASSAPEYAGQVVEFGVSEPIKPPKTKEDVRWSDYSRGVVAELIAAGIPIVGMDALITNTLPPGSGLSSSAALETSTGLACLTLAGLKMDPQRLALICQKAEHEFAHVPCGIMDQTIIANGRAGHAMLLDCRDLSKHFVQIDPMELRVVIVNSLVKHELSGGEYAERRKQCFEGVAHFRKGNEQVKALRDVNLTQLESVKTELPELVYRRCRHVISENVRTTDAAAKLSNRRYEEVGELMLASHRSLQHDYEVSVEELDFLVEESMKIKGVYGARMTGAGFGGCIIALVQPRQADAYKAQIQAVYQRKYSKIPTVFVTDATAGVSVLE